MNRRNQSPGGLCVAPRKRDDPTRSPEARPQHRRNDAGGHEVAGSEEDAARRCLVLTRNLKHFAPLGVAARDSFDSLPPL